MKQKLLCLLAALAFLLPARLSAFNYKYEGVTLRYEVIDEEAKTCKVSGYKDFSGALVIPDVANDGTADYSVIEIGEEAFENFKDMTSIVIGNSVTEIGEYAFHGCWGLTSVVIPESVTSIGDYAFWYCSGLTSVVIGNSVKTIGEEAFEGCSGLTSVVIPNSVTKIGWYAFNGCTGLIKSAYPKTLEKPFYKGTVVDYNPEGAIIEDGWVWGPEKSAIYFAPLNLEGEYTIPESVTEIGSSAFYNCEGLTSVVIPNSVTSIGKYAFNDCSGLASVQIGNSVTSIGERTFSNCNGLTSVVIGNSVQTIGVYAFYYCRGLTSVEIPNSVTEIGWSAFKDCSGLKSVVIGNSVTKIGKSAFDGCRGLTSVEIPNSVTEIGKSAFEGCSGLKSVVIGNSVTSIGMSAFYDCSGLTSVVIPNSVQTIGESAFKYCRNLDTIIMGYGVKSIALEAFSQCPASSIYITAQTPPELASNTFSNYKGMLYLQGQAAVNAYDDDKYWGNFNNELMTVPTALEIEGLNSISGNAEDTFQLKAKMTPEDVTLPYILWRSTNPKIATVDNNGLMELQEYSAEDLTRAEGDEDNDGTCKIIAESLYFDGPIAEIIVNNTGVAAASIALDESNLDLKVGQSAKLTATVKNVEDKTVTWTSSNDAVATVDAEGNVTAVAVGEADITATCGSVSASCKVTVLPILVESLTIDPTAWSGEEGSEFSIKATVLPENADDKTLSFESNDTSVATVDAEGNVKVQKEGSCVITVATTDGSNLTAECVITSLSGVDAIFADPSVKVNVYDLNGVMLKKGCSREELKQLKPAVYILRSGDTVVKAVVK